MGQPHNHTVIEGKQIKKMLLKMLYYFLLPLLSVSAVKCIYLKRAEQKFA